MSSVETFLAKQQRYTCERLAAALTVEQCEQNRTREGNIQKGINNVMQCEGCTGLGKAVEIKERVMAKTVEEIAAEKPWVMKVCTECKAPKKIHSHGQCAKCLYKKYGKAMKPPKVAAAPSVVPPVTPLLQLLHAPPVLSITLDFSADPDVYRQLVDKGIDEEQVVGLLSMLLDGELRRVA